jgi:hypothetical protein
MVQALLQGIMKNEKGFRRTANAERYLGIKTGKIRRRHIGKNVFKD